MNQVHKQNSEEALTTNLQDFGLDPRDWILKKNDEVEYLIENKDDPEFLFRGILQPDQTPPKWGYLALLNL